MKIIEIRNTAYGEVAYVLDGGRILKVPIEDYTANKPAREGELEYEEMEIERPRKKIKRRIEVGEETIDNPIIPSFIPKDKQQMVIEDDELVVKEKPVFKPQRQNIPRHLQGIFVGPDQPGHAEEVRRV